MPVWVRVCSTLLNNGELKACREQLIDKGFMADVTSWSEFGLKRLNEYLKLLWDST